MQWIGLGDQRAVFPLSILRSVPRCGTVARQQDAGAVAAFVIVPTSIDVDGISEESGRRGTSPEGFSTGIDNSIELRARGAK